LPFLTYGLIFRDGGKKRGWMRAGEEAIMKLSVVMTVYNGEDYLTEAIESILKQTYKEFEFIIVNDGSVDRTREILDHLDDNRVRVFHLEKNFGMTYCLNFGIQQAKGTWIVRQDADDISLPQRLEEQLKYIQAYSDAVAVGTLIKSIPGKMPISEHLLQSYEWSNRLLTREEIRRFRFIAPPVVHGSLTFSKQLFHELGGYNERYKIAQDFDLIIRLLEVGPIDKVPKVLYHYRVDPRSLSRKNETETCDESMRVASDHIRDMIRKKAKTEPIFALIGPKKGCQYFSSRICSENRLMVCKFIYTEEAEPPASGYELFQSGKIDGIMILSGPGSETALHYLQERGMELNRNLFSLWNVFV
jgi:glycosyltransferase involved in cell wall biosynthesis